MAPFQLHRYGLAWGKRPEERRYQVGVPSAIIREPQNTWTNLAFVFVGMLIAGHDRRPFSRLLGCAVLGLGIGSGLYHASLLPSLRTLDVVFMGFVVVALLCVGIETLGEILGTKWLSLLPSSAKWMIGIGGCALAATAAYLRNDVRVDGVKPFDTTYVTVGGVLVTFALVVAGIVVVARRNPAIRIPMTPLLVTGITVLVAGFCQINDRPDRLLSAPENLIQGHSVWHLGMALAIVAAYDLFAGLQNREPLLLVRKRTGNR